MLRNEMQEEQTKNSTKLKKLYSRYIPATVIMRDQLHEEFGINIDKCELVEETFLKLAGVNEKPFKECSFSIHENSNPPLVSFELALRDPEEIKKLEAYSTQNGIKFYDYTHELSPEEQKSNIYLICLDSEGVINKLLPAIINFFRENPKELIKYSDKYNSLNVIEDLPKTTSSWAGFFNCRNAGYAVGIIGAAMLTGIISNKFKI
jgi:hypothetical protein